MHYWLVMPAAGASQRFGGTRPKQHLALGARTVLEEALQLFLDDVRCAGIALALDLETLADAGLRLHMHPQGQDPKRTPPNSNHSPTSHSPLFIEKKTSPRSRRCPASGN